MSETGYDIIIVGSGAGGGTMAYALAGTTARVLVLERGDFVPQEDENWSPKAVWADRRYQTSECWLDADGNVLHPYTHYCVGGNTKFWGAALFRLRRQDFEEMQHAGGTSPAWPVGYDTFAPYYDRAERLYEVRGGFGVDPTDPPREAFPFLPIEHSGRMPEIVERLRGEGLHPSPLPIGLRSNCVPCRTCNSFACKLHAKSEADVCCVRPALQHANITLWTNAQVTRIHTDQTGRRATAVDVVRDGRTERIAAGLIVVSCGAVNSAALLLRSANDAHPHGLANSSGLVGRRYMAHQATMISAFDWDRENETVFQKTVAINDYYLGDATGRSPLGQIQSQGRTDAVTLRAGAPSYCRPIPLFMWKWWASHSVDWLVMSEDLPDPDNRVTVEDGRIRLHYRQNNTVAHRTLVEKTKGLLRRLGFDLIVKHSLGTKNTTHQCGTLVFGTDPRSSVLDVFGRSHDVENLFVVDASFFPSSAAVNPGLTIVAQALRAADHIKDTEL